MRRGLISVGLFVAFVAILALSRHVVDSNNSATTTTAPKTTTTTTPTTTSTVAQSDDCLASDFSGAYNEGEGAAGTIYASVTVTKSTAGSCTLKGWPILTLQNRLGGVLPMTAIDVPTASSGFQFLTAQANAAPTTLTIQDGGTATFSLGYSDVQVGTTACESAVTVSVQFVKGGASIPVTPQYAVQPCNDGQLWLSPFYS
ncbi:MAG TPA: DUF4232 domain-containing protein [Acidimicrobiales bacterium]